MIEVNTTTFIFVILETISLIVFYIAVKYRSGEGFIYAILITAIINLVMIPIQLQNAGWVKFV